MNLSDIFTRLPYLEGLDLDLLDCYRVGGLTNDNFRLIGNGQDVILRLPREQTSQWIDRQVERHNLNLAVAVGLSPPYRVFDDSGVMLSDCLVASSELTIEQLRDPAILSMVANRIRQLHGCQPAFQGRVDLAGLINRYYHLMAEQDQQQLADVYKESIALLVELASISDNSLVSSHNDLVLQNLLLDGDRLWIIDWEFSSLASPYWDLATFCNEALMDDDAAAEWLELYANGRSGFYTAHLKIYRTLLKFLGDFWIRAFQISC